MKPKKFSHSPSSYRPYYPSALSTESLPSSTSSSPPIIASSPPSDVIFQSRPYLAPHSSSSSISLASTSSHRHGRKSSRLRDKTLAVLAVAAERTPIGPKKPKFELHLKIHDLNNVPLISGSCFVKHHLSHSLHAEHRGRTPKSPIANHRVDFGPYARLISSVRIAVDRTGSLAECPLELEVLQELDLDASSRGEDKIVRLGIVRLNLSEYVEESDALVRELGPAFGTPGAAGGVMSPGSGTLGGGAFSSPPARKRAGSTGTSAPNPPNTDSRPATATANSNTNTTSNSASSNVNAATPNASNSFGCDNSTHAAVNEHVEVKDGIVRRYLLQDSKINSTLRLSILMVQIDGDRNYAAPPLRKAAVFGGIAGLLTGDQSEQPDESGQLLTTSKSKDANSEVYDMYRRALAASWSRHPDELAADEIIEDIFAGGDGWRGGHSTTSASASNSLATLTNNRNPPCPQRTPNNASTPMLDNEPSSSASTASIDTLRPHHHHNIHHTLNTDSNFLQIPSLHRFGSSASAASSAVSSPGEPALHLSPLQAQQAQTQAQIQPQTSTFHNHHLPHPVYNLFHHRRKPSGASDRSSGFFSLAAATTSAPVLSEAGVRGRVHEDIPPIFGRDRERERENERENEKESIAGNSGTETRGSRARGDSFTSLMPASGDADRPRGGESMVRRTREVYELHVREDLIAWTISGQSAA